MKIKTGMQGTMSVLLILRTFLKQQLWIWEEFYKFDMILPRANIHRISANLLCEQVPRLSKRKDRNLMNREVFSPFNRKQIL